MFAPIAVSLTRVMKSRATSRLTSASSSARRISRRPSFTSVSVSWPPRDSLRIAAAKRSCRVSNIGEGDYNERWLRADGYSGQGKPCPYNSDMIARYTRPEMGRLFTDQYKYETWLEVELAVAEAWARRDEVPGDAVARIREN